MEKFALLNLLKALETLAPKQNSGQNSEQNFDEHKPPVPSAQQKPDSVQTLEIPNVMASVLERHEAISNRIKNNRR